VSFNEPKLSVIKMRKIILNIMLILLLFCTLSCNNLKTTITEDIKVNKEKYNKLAEAIYKCDFSRFSYNQYIGKEYFPEILVAALNDTKLKDKVQYISLYKSSYCDNNSFNLKSGEYHIWYDSCPKSSFYLNEKLMDEWRVDNNWSITKSYR